MVRWGLIVAWLILAASSSVCASSLLFDDPLADYQWYHDEMGFNDAWGTIYALPRRGQTLVAVLDSGFQTDHPDLQQNIVGGINIVDGSTNISPVHPHGTGTGGIPGASSGNDEGISQSAWTANLLPIRISNRSDGAAYVTDIARAITFAADSGARVINISYGGVSNKTIAKAAQYAYRKGTLVFMAAGNSGQKTRWRNYRYIIAVGSVSEQGQRSDFSTYGRFVDFVAPGENITTLFTEDGYADWTGTSFASPIAASVAALVLTANPELSPGQVLKILRKTAIRTGRRRRDLETGYGLLDADAAVELALQTRGRYRNHFRRQGIDPYVQNDWADFSGVLDLASLDLGGNGSLGTVAPQGFLVPSTQQFNIVSIPEPATIVLMLLAALLLAPRPKRATAAVHHDDRIFR